MTQLDHIHTSTDKDHTDMAVRACDAGAINSSADLSHVDLLAYLYIKYLKNQEKRTDTSQ